MTDLTPPCRRTENDPDDWFIERDGRQYADEPVLGRDEVRALWDECVEKDLDPMEELKAANDKRLQENLVKRRRAKDKCFTECPMRLACLQRGLDENFVIQQYGIWGGYYPEELRQIQRQGRARRKQRTVAASE